jgi:hypothetical protein
MTLSHPQWLLPLHVHLPHSPQHLPIPTTSQSALLSAEAIIFLSTKKFLRNLCNSEFYYGFNKSFKLDLVFSHFNPRVIFILYTSYYVGRDSSVGIATRYGLDGPGIEFRWGRDFQHRSRPNLGPTQPPVQRVPGLFQVVKRPGRGVDHPPRSNAGVKERVQLYLYSPSGPSWHVLG